MAEKPTILELGRTRKRSCRQLSVQYLKVERSVWVKKGRENTAPSPLGSELSLTLNVRSPPLECTYFRTFLP